MARPFLSPLTVGIVGNLVLRIASNSTGLMLGLYLQHINQTVYPISATEVGMFAVTFYLAELTLAPVFGTMSDRRGRRLFMLLGSLFGLVAVVMTGLTTVLVILLVTRLLEGLSTASSAPAILGLLSTETDDDAAKRGRSMAFFEVATIIGIAGGATAGGHIWAWLGSNGFFFVAGIYALSLVIFLFIREHPTTRRTHHVGPGRFFQLITTPRVLRFAPAWLAVNAIVGIWFSHGVFQFSKHPDPQQFLSGLSGPVVGNFFGVFGLFFLVGCVLWGFLYARFSRPTLMLLALSGIFIDVAALYLLNRYGHLGAPLLPVLVAILLGAVLIWSGFTPAALGYLAEIAESFPKERGTIMGFYSIFLGGGQLLGGLLGGPFADARGVNGLILLTFLVGLVALVTVLLLRVRPMPEAERSRLEPAGDIAHP
ncbi:MAG: MFS transporter [Dehalococcoidia bacterium]